MLIVSLVITYNNALNAAKDSSIELYLGTLRSCSSHIETNMQAIYSTSVNVAHNADLRALASQSQPIPSEDKVALYDPVRRYLQQQKNILTDIYSFSGFHNYYLYLSHQNDLIISSLTYFEDVPPRTMFTYRASDQTSRYKWQYAPSHEFISYDGNWINPSRTQNITANIPIYGKIGETAAVLSVNINADYVSDTLNASFSETAAQYLVFDDEGTIIASSDSIDATGSLADSIIDHINNGTTQASFNIDVDNTDYLICQYYSNYTSWNYIAFSPQNTLNESMNFLDNMLVAMAVISILLASFVTFFISRFVTRPLNVLRTEIDRISTDNDFDARITEIRNDEFGDVYTKFNIMAESLKQLTENLTNEKLLHKEMEIRLLQNQINPHFLYNTLESLYSMASISHQDKMTGIILALSKFFRVSLSTGRNIVPLEKSIELARHYITIHNNRFENSVTMNVHVEGSFLMEPVPKFLIQPLVENSIKHGFSGRDGHNVIDVDACLQDGQIIIRVADNGAGIDKAVLGEINNSLLMSREIDGDNHYALHNINAQIMLMYGEGYGLHLTSNDKGGVTVVVNIPFAQPDD